MTDTRKPGDWVRCGRLQALAQRLCDAPALTAQGADLMVRLDHAALDWRAMEQKQIHPES